MNILEEPPPCLIEGMIYTKIGPFTKPPNIKNEEINVTLSNGTTITTDLDNLRPDALDYLSIDTTDPVIITLDVHTTTLTNLEVFSQNTAFTYKLELYDTINDTYTEVDTNVSLKADHFSHFLT